MDDSKRRGRPVSSESDYAANDQARHFVVTIDLHGMNLDRFVARRLEVSRRLARRMIRTGAVRVNNRVTRVMTRPLRARQRVSVEHQRGIDTHQSPVQTALSSERSNPVVLHLESGWLAIDKPAGLLSEADASGAPSVETVVPRLLRQRGERSSDVYLVHRLDAGTSGVMVLARRQKFSRWFHRIFRERDVDKRYLALVGGRLDRNERVERPIGRVQGRRHGVCEHGKAARTDFFPLEVRAQASLLQANPQTGRTHQIRVHASHLGYPILGDRLYGGLGYTFDAASEVIPRPMLHAFELHIPVDDGPRRVFRAGVPPDFRRVAGAFGIAHPVLASTKLP